MGLHLPEVNTDVLPVPVLRTLNVARHLAWSTLGADLQGAGLIAQDSVSGDVLIIGQSYGPRDTWYMPGGGLDTYGGLRNGVTGTEPDIDMYELAAAKEFKQEVRPTDGVRLSDLTYLTTSVNKSGIKGRVTDKFAVFHSQADGLNDYVESFRDAPKSWRRRLSKETAKLWMVPPDWLAVSDLNMHHALRKGVKALAE